MAAGAAVDAAAEERARGEARLGAGPLGSRCASSACPTSTRQPRRAVRATPTRGPGAGLSRREGTPEIAVRPLQDLGARPRQRAAAAAGAVGSRTGPGGSLRRVDRLTGRQGIGARHRPSSTSGSAPPGVRNSRGEVGLQAGERLHGRPAPGPPPRRAGPPRCPTAQPGPGAGPPGRRAPSAGAARSPAGTAPPRSWCPRG